VQTDDRGHEPGEQTAHLEEPGHGHAEGRQQGKDYLEAAGFVRAYQGMTLYAASR
jgi:hypothetical protein